MESSETSGRSEHVPVPCGSAAGNSAPHDDGRPAITGKQTHSRLAASFHVNLGLNLQNILRFIIRLSQGQLTTVTLRSAKITLRNIVSQYVSTISDDLTIMQVNCTKKSPACFVRCFVN